MDKYEKFKDAVKSAASLFSQIPKDKVIRIISHFDTDGISSGAIIAALLMMEGRRFHLTNVPHTTRQLTEELAREEYEVLIFTDLGSSQIQNFEELLSDRIIFVLDHHQLSKSSPASFSKINHINPMLYDIEGDFEISGSGVAYMFAKAVDPRMIDYAHLALLGAVADRQETSGFFGLNAEILSDAIKMGKISVSQGLRLFGGFSKPVHKVLEFATDYFIPGVTGNESGALQLLSEAGINSRNSGGELKKLNQLTEKEAQKLVDAILKRRKAKEEDEDESIYGNLYLLKNEPNDSQYKDIREFSTIINAAGRLGHSSIGIGACLGDDECKKAASKFLNEYHYSLVSAIKWLEEKRGTLNFYQREGYAIINAEKEISASIIGTVASIISRSQLIRPKSVIVAMARENEKITKVSMRYAGKSNPYNLRDICGKVTEGLSMTEFGGHYNAAGCSLKTEDEDKFIENVEHHLEKLSIEEKME